jgi:G:T-mismatch repair DNA endonuclease (very short patch repair protein)
MKLCSKCQNPVSKNCKTGFCNSCRDRSGINNPFFGRTHNIETIDAMKIKCRIKSKELWLKDDYRSKVIERSSKPRHKDFKVNQSKNTKKYYNEHPEQKIVRSIEMKQRWLSGKMNDIIKKESFAEREMFNALKLLFVDVEKKQIVINEKVYVPDCICFGNTIIEYYGDYWHANPNRYKKNDIVHSNKTAEEIWNLNDLRIKDLESVGYKCIIIWESEWKTKKDDIIIMLSNELNYDCC